MNKTQSIQLNMAGLAVNAFQMNLLGNNEINFNLPEGNVYDAGEGDNTQKCHDGAQWREQDREGQFSVKPYTLQRLTDRDMAAFRTIRLDVD
ncbi:hypothetical protein WDV93_04360 [Pantoea ananatis]